MNKLILPGFLCLLGFSSLAQVSNGDFEDWTKLVLFEHPNTGMNTMSSNYDTFFANGELNVTRIESEDNSILHIENMQIENEVIPGYYIFGKSPNSAGETLTFADGFDFSDVNATGISLDIKMDIPLTEPGFVMVQFKSQGEPVGPGNHGTGTYLYYVVGTQDWTNMEFAFNEAIDPSTDQCVIALASADLIENDAPFAAGASIEVDNIEFINSDVEVPGGTFESWVYVQPIFVPEDCHVDVDPFDRNYEDSDVAFEGQHALGLRTLINNGNVEPATAVMGNVNEEGGITPTIALESNHSNLSFMYAYAGVGEDVAMASIVFYNEVEDEYMPVYTHNIELNSNGGYQMASYHFADDMVENFADAKMVSVSFVSSKIDNENIPQNGSFLLVDDVSLSGSLGIFDRVNTRTELGVLAYPNPTMGRVMFNFGMTRSGYFVVLNQAGQQIGVQAYADEKRVYFDLSEVRDGSYLFKFFHLNGQQQSSRVMKL